MKLELKANMYVRTKNRGIAKFRGWNAYDENKVAIHTHNEGDIEITPVIDKNTIIKASYNIIDLIEVGDYVNGEKVLETNCKWEYMDDDSDTGVNEVYDGLELQKGRIYFEYEIETVVTKEQMEQIAYKVVE